MTSKVVRCIGTYLNLSQTNMSSELPHILLWYAMHPGQVPCSCLAHAYPHYPSRVFGFGDV